LSYKRALIRLLDRPGGRFLLGKIATSFLRRIGGDGVEIAYVEGLWTRCAGSDFFPDGLGFDYKYADFDSWKRQMDVYAADTKEYWLQHYRPQEGDVIVDVGAGHGEDTLTFSRAVGQTGRVIAIEAHPITFAILKNFCRLNRLTNVTPLHLALMDTPGTVRIVESQSSWMENEVIHGEASSAIAVRAATFEQVCKEQGLDDIAFLKMNIEGAERFALSGMEPVIDRVHQICVACHDFRYRQGHGEHFRTRAFVERFLVNHGFSLASRPDDPGASVPDHIFGLRYMAAAERAT
jgi:FkbM family methyltransferase